MTQTHLFYFNFQQTNNIPRYASIRLLGAHRWTTSQLYADRYRFGAKKTTTGKGDEVVGKCLGEKGTKSVVPPGAIYTDEWRSHTLYLYTYVYGMFICKCIVTFVLIYNINQCLNINI